MRIAFIGTGGIAQQHAKGLVQQEDVQFVGAYDVIADKAHQFTTTYGGQAYVDMAEMLDQAKPDAVWICLPPFAHGPAEMAVLERRIPFLVEKPMSNTMATAREILEIVERTGVITAVGYMNRYRQGINRAKALLAQDQPVLMHGAWIGGTPKVAWWRVKAQSGGQIVEQTTHIFDLVRYLMGEPKTVYAMGACGFVNDLPGYDVEDASAVAIEFISGAVGNLMSCCANSSGGGGVHLTIVAKEMVAAFTGWEQSAVITTGKDEEVKIAGEPDIFAIEDATFLQAVRDNNPGLIRAPYADAIKSLAFCLAANTSLETGQPVNVASL